MFTTHPVTNSTQVITAALITHFFAPLIPARLMRYISAKHTPPHKSIVQCVHPRHKISSTPYMTPPKTKTAKYSAKPLNSVCFLYATSISPTAPFYHGG